MQLFGKEDTDGNNGDEGVAAAEAAQQGHEQEHDGQQNSGALVLELIEAEINQVIQRLGGQRDLHAAADDQQQGQNHAGIGDSLVNVQQCLPQIDRGAVDLDIFFESCGVLHKFTGRQDVGQDGHEHHQPQEQKQQVRQLELFLFFDLSRHFEKSSLFLCFLDLSIKAGPLLLPLRIRSFMSPMRNMTKG